MSVAPEARGNFGKEDVEDPRAPASSTKVFRKLDWLGEIDSEEDREIEADADSDDMLLASVVGKKTSGATTGKEKYKEDEDAAPQRWYAWAALNGAATLSLMFVLLFTPSIFVLMMAALLWKGELNLMVHMSFLVLLLFVMCCLPCKLLCCRRGDVSPVGLRWLQSRRWLIAVSLTLGWVLCVKIVLFLYRTDQTSPLLKTDFDASLPVAVIGSGPSGISASWLLAKGGRKVTTFESLGEIGGHSKSWVENTNGRRLTVDLGYIFNNQGGYHSYKHFVKHFNRTLVDSALNTSGYFNDEYWDNTGDQERFDAPLKEEIARFSQLASLEPNIFRTLTPMGLWLWYNGFSKRFTEICLKSTLTVLFVTKMGVWKQSAQATLNHFRSEGFTHLRYPGSKVQFTRGGSQFMWKDVVKDMMSTGRAQVRLNSRVTSVAKEGGLWTLTLADGSKQGGFGDVVMACPANVATKIVSGRYLERLTLSTIDYIEASVALHTDAQATIGQNFRQASGDVLYFVSHNHMTGKIGKIFQDHSSDLLLTVHGQEHAALKIDPAKTKWSTTWSHHYFTLFELVVARRIVPLFNNGAGLHWSGDWLYGLGHDDAIQSGIHAACAVGIPRKPPDASSDPLYSNLLGRVCRFEN